VAQLREKRETRREERHSVAGAGNSVAWLEVAVRRLEGLVMPDKNGGVTSSVWSAQRRSGLLAQQ
jgi:hypothetical protein